MNKRQLKKFIPGIKYYASKALIKYLQSKRLRKRAVKLGLVKKCSQEDGQKTLMITLKYLKSLK